MLLSSCDTCSSGNFYYKLNVSFHSHVCTLKYSSSYAPDPSLKLPVVNPRARERAIPKTKQPRPPPSTVKPVVEEIMLIGGPGSQSDLNLLSMPGGNFGGASTVIPEPGKAKHGIQLPSSLSEDSQMQPGCLRTPAILTVTHDVSQDSESNLNLPSIQAGDCTGDCPQSSSPPPELIENAARNSAGCEIFCDSLLRNENQDTESSSEEGYLQMS